jgi:hypothetical protein
METIMSCGKIPIGPTAAGAAVEGFWAARTAVFRRNLSEDVDGL